MRHAALIVATASACLGQPLTDAQVAREVPHVS